MDKRKQEKPGRFATDVAFVNGKQKDAGLTVNGTTKVPIASPRRRSYVERASAQVITLPADADGTFLATLKKYDASADADVSLTSALDLEASLIANESVAFAFISTLTDAQRTLDEGDVLRVDVVNNSAAVETQPDGLIFTAELLALE